MKSHIHVGLTRKEYILISDALANMRDKSYNDLSLKLDFIAENAGWFRYADDSDSDWQDGHPFDFGDR